MAKETILDIHGLKTHILTSRGVVEAVAGVDLRIKEGKAVGLVGESGCGKTTTALSITRLLPDSCKIVGGSVLYRDKNLLELTENGMRKVLGKEIAMVFQNPLLSLNPVMKIGDQIAEAVSLHQHIGKAKAKKASVEALEMVNISLPSTVAKEYPHQLSGGMRQRVMIAMAIACNPSLLILDEPTSALDVTIQLQILQLIKEIRRKRDFSILLITHDLGIIAELCDEVYVMYAGKIMESLDVFEFFRKPRHPYSIALLRSTLSVEQCTSTFFSIEGSVPSLVNPSPGCRFYDRCSLASTICQEKQPPKVEIGNDHYIYCFHAG